MTEDDLRALLPEFEAFHGRFSRFFRRPQVRELSRQYLTGLSLPIDRKNVENISEQVGAHRRALQLFISESPWDDQGCIDELQRFVAEQFGAPGGVLVLDDTGFAKRGSRSAGVARQYSGTLGRVDNCQVGTFMVYASAHGHTLVDRALYVPEAWFAPGEAEENRRKLAGIPEETVFHTKIELAKAMLKRAVEVGHLPFQWATGDAAFGDSHDLRQTVDELGKWYCFEVSSTAEVWTEDPQWEVPEQTGRGRRFKNPQPTTTSPEPLTVAEVVAGLPGSAWIRHRVTEGEKGPREYEFARMRVIERRHGKPGPPGWLMLRRPVGGGDDKVKGYLSNAPETVALAELARVGCLRWTIEENFKLGKGEVGLDHYEVTKHRGWYHHITMSLLALAFLKSTQREWGKKTDEGKRPRDSETARSGAAASGVGCESSYRMAA